MARTADDYHQTVGSLHALLRLGTSASPSP
jgi:hypothetical protein